MAGPGGEGASASAAQFAVEVDTLKTFRDRVDGLLKSLDAGAGSERSIGAQVMDPGHPGTGFTEVDALVTRYQETHAKLVQLSQTLSRTIDAMSISVDIARLGYEHVDKDEIARLWSLHDQEAAAAGQTQAAPPTGAAVGRGGRAVAL